ncbi:hypothetical protein HNR42_000775 [Deinobacterium chartae]|uniref:Uncharacterized protein n=1 Tax=Deinobacterium chartae TaxID=521158 RepID=A0A841HV54_9DEIO|nr:hypothetical protein [Deinobacterium chartae]MBB6097361.1 hypothetical protein [Deinobacterium chartae]
MNPDVAHQFALDRYARILEDARSVHLDLPRKPQATAAWFQRLWRLPLVRFRSVKSGPCLSC